MSDVTHRYDYCAIRRLFLINFLFAVDDRPVAQSLAKLTVNFQSSLSISDSTSEAANSTGTAGDSCSLQQYCDTGCQTDIMGEVGDVAAQMRTIWTYSHCWKPPSNIWNDSYAVYNRYFPSLCEVRVPGFLALGGQSETQLAVRGSQEKVSLFVCLLFNSHSTMTHQHAAQALCPVGGRVMNSICGWWSWLLSDVWPVEWAGWSHSSLASLLLTVCCLCVHSQRTAQRLAGCTPCPSTTWFNVHTV